jgi:hypothetical protein
VIGPLSATPAVSALPEKVARINNPLAKRVLPTSDGHANGSLFNEKSVPYLAMRKFMCIFSNLYQYKLLGVQNFSHAQVKSCKNLPLFEKGRLQVRNRGTSLWTSP